MAGDGPHLCLEPVLALPLSVFLRWQVVLPLRVPGAIGLQAIARKGMQAQRGPPASGQEAMVGERAGSTRGGTGRQRFITKGKPGARFLANHCKPASRRVSKRWSG